MKERFLADQDIVRKKIQSAITKVHLSVDVWTSPSYHLHLAVCSHFIDIEEKSYDILLGLPELLAHHGEHQFYALLPILENFGLTQKLGAVIGDNSGTNDTLCRTISTWLAKEKKITWNPTFWRIRCSGHMINLFAQAFILFEDEFDLIELYGKLEEEEEDNEQQQKELEIKFRSLGVLGKLHNVIIHIRASPGRTKDFKSRAGRRIPINNRTRWNSWWTMLDVAIQLQDSVNSYISRHLDTIEKGDQLTVQDWHQLYQIREFLEPFKSATLKLEGGRVTLDQVLRTFDVLKLHYSQTLVCRTTLLNYNLLISSRKRSQIPNCTRTFELELYEARRSLTTTIRRYS